MLTWKRPVFTLITLCAPLTYIFLKSELICKGTQARVWGEDFISLHQPLRVCVCVWVYGSLAHPNEEGWNSRNATLRLKWEGQARKQGNDGARGKDWKKTSSSCVPSAPNQWLKHRDCTTVRPNRSNDSSCKWLHTALMLWV